MQPIEEDVYAFLERLAELGLIEIGLDDKGIDYQVSKWVKELG